jgi:hypothetical protein
MIHKFKVIIPVPTKSKMEIVSSFKKLQKRKLEAARIKTPSTSARNLHASISHEEAIKKRKAAVMENKDEILADISKKRMILGKEMESLHSVRLSLIWLLHKATLLETQRNHM